MPSQQSMQLWQVAEGRLAMRDMDGARTMYQQLLGDREVRPMAELRLSTIASSQSRHRDAVAHAVAAFEARWPHAGMLAMIAQRLAMLGETEAALACAMAPEIVHSRDPALLADVGNLLAYNTFPDEALALFERARSLGRDDATLGYLIGLTCKYAGDDARARDELARSLRAQPDLGVAYWELSKLDAKIVAQPEWIDRLRAAIRAKRPDAPDLPLMHYALFRALDTLGDTGDAWQALSEGMRLRRRQVRYNGDDEQALFDLLGAIKAPAADGEGPDGPRPIFIVGMPRSGTTLLERVLGNHPDVHGAGELFEMTGQLRWMCDAVPAPYLDAKLAARAEGFDFAELGRRYASHTQWRAKGFACYVDKMPANFLNVSYIVRALPRAKILHMVRGPMDTCFSNLKECFANGYAHSYDQLEMADHFRRYRTLMAHWRAAYPGRILDVRYDDLVAEPERTAREVIEFCGLPWSDGLSAIEGRSGTVATASSVQVREPIHGRFLHQWRRYEAHLGPMRERLGALAY